MIEDLSKRLIDVSEKKRLKEKLVRDLLQTQAQIKKEQARLKLLEARLQVEQLDVKRLEELSLKALFATVLGSREEQIAKEKQELLLAQMQTRQAQKSVLALQHDIEYLNHQVSLLDTIEQEYQSLLQAKEKQLLQTNAVAAKEILEISERIAATQSEIKELDEALSAGQTVLTGLDQAVSELQSARDMGTWDLIGGGILTTMIKHDRMDDARASIEQVQIDLLRFKRELADVQQSAEMQIEMEPLERFADMFLDGLIIDWIVQSKINNSLEQVVLMRAHIQEVSGVLQSRQQTALDTLKNLQNKKSGLIEKF